MHPHLLEYYNAELAYLHELGSEFAEQHPKIANRLGMNGMEVADPYVERLFEGAALLNAGIQLKMDQQFPQFSQSLLEAHYPNYLLPTPSMTIVALQPEGKEGSLTSGFHVPRHSSLLSNKSKGEETACQFRTAHDVTLWPLEIVSVNCTAAPPDLSLKGTTFERPVKGAIRICLKTTKGMMAALRLDTLTFHLAGDENITSYLYEAIFSHAVGVVGCETARPVTWLKLLEPDSICLEGFDDTQSVMPVTHTAFQGHRLLHEYFAFPQRFLFFTLAQLQPVIANTQGDTLELIILLDRAFPQLEGIVDKTHLALFCTPAINLFPKSIEGLAIDTERSEHPLSCDVAKPQNFEIYSITSLSGTEEEGGILRQFQPLNMALGSANNDHDGYYSVRRELDMQTEAKRRPGMRTNFIGSETLLSLFNHDHTRFSGKLKSISVEFLSTNRDLPLLLPQNESSDFTMLSSVPVESTRIVCGPTTPKIPLAESAATWRLISHLNINYLTLSELNEDDGPQALRDFLSIYLPLADASCKKQIEAIAHTSLEQIVRRFPRDITPLGYGVGVGIHITIDEELFGNTSPYLFGAILEQLFARHVGQYSFTETTLHTMQRGEIAHWKPRLGKRPIV